MIYHGFSLGLRDPLPHSLSNMRRSPGSKRRGTCPSWQLPTESKRYEQRASLNEKGRRGPRVIQGIQGHRVLCHASCSARIVQECQECVVLSSCRGHSIWRTGALLDACRHSVLCLACYHSFRGKMQEMNFTAAQAV